MKELNVGSHLSRYWSIYTSIIFVVAIFVSYGNRLAFLEARQLESNSLHQALTNKIDDQSVQFAEIKARLASIDTSLQYLKEKR